ncbi:hypothetical protein COOONC_09897 [Cooperia oncophora]
MENGVDFVAAWLACAKIGVISAWINTNLRKEALAQSLTSSRASVVLCSSSLQQALVEMIESGTTSMRPLVIFSRGKSKRALHQTNSKTSSRTAIFATHISTPHVISRYFYIATGGECAFGVRPKTDRIYVCLPLYHTSAGVLGKQSGIIGIEITFTDHTCA